MPQPNSALLGPDFLEAVADKQLANGLEVDAAEFRNRADEWRQDRRAREAAESALHTLRERMEAATRALQAAA